MAAVRTMLSVAREEAVLISAEVAATARTAISETATTGSAAGASAAGAARAEAVNPLAVRAAMEVAAKEVGSTAGISRSIAEVASRDAVAGESILAQHLALAPKPIAGPSTVSTLLESSSHSSGRLVNLNNTGARSIIAEAIQQDAGATLREVMSNSVQTGVEEQMDQMVDVARQLAPEVAKEAESVLGQEGIGLKNMLEAVQEAAAEMVPART